MYLIEAQLQWLLDLLREHQVPYWLNSGTLLGLMREGKLLDSDEDIDVSLWAKHENELKRVLTYFKKAGYRLMAVDYRGLRFQYNFSLGGEARQRSIDINLFRRCGEYAWCPEYYFKVQPGSVGKGKSYAGALRRVLRFYWRKMIAQISFRISISSWPWCSFINQATWWIPAFYFDNLEFNEKIAAFVPADWKSYLELRYGDWTVPCREWIFHRDDGGLIDCPPDLLLHRYAEGKTLTQP